MEGLIPAFELLRNSGKLFVELCSELLKEMGFTNIYQRKGSELGRDIDAELNDQKWFFECKYRGKKEVSTPEAAYKFLQLDMLHEDMKPDYFVLISNASMKSILKDIVEFKGVDRHTMYSVEAWTNEPNEQYFNAILLSYPETYIRFIQEKFEAEERWLGKLFDDFRSRSQDFLRTNMRFFDKYRFGIAGIRKKRKRSSIAEDFLLNEVHKTLVRHPRGWAVMIIGCPRNPISGLYDFTDLRSCKSLCELLKPWDVIFEERRENHMVFAEVMHHTFFFDFGAVVTISDILYGGILMPDEWLKALRNDCLRMRNFVKRGMLLTPAVFRAYVANLFPSREKRVRTEPYALGGIERFLPNIHDSKYDGNVDAIIPFEGIQSDDVFVDTPFKMHRDIGIPLATSLWKNAGMKKPLLLSAQEVDKKLLEDYQKDEVSLDDYMNSSVEWQYSFNWLFGKEFIDTSYSYFEELLRRKNEQVCSE